MTKKLYAILIGINNYPRREHRLRGCLNDLQAVHQYLEHYMEQQGIEYQPKILKDEAATKDQIIEAFEHYKEAKDGDSCLFYFAGHGSRIPAPEAFWHLESDHKLQTLVCWDSRIKDGEDLVDKELSYLIWEATKNKDVHFVVIMDCCYSGLNTRIDPDDLPVYEAVRMAKANTKGKTLESYLGIEHYKKGEDGALSPPRARHVLLSAAKSTETAKEVYCKRQPRGVFSYSLIETLQNSGQPLSYARIMDRVNLRVSNLVPKQSPQIDVIHQEDTRRKFLDGQHLAEKKTYLVSRQKNGEWTVNAGAIDGIKLGDDVTETVFELLDSRIRLAVVEVHPTHAVLAGSGTLDHKQIYQAELVSLASPLVPIAIDPNGDPEIGRTIKGTLLQSPSKVIELSTDPEAGEYSILAEKAGLSLNFKSSQKPLFKQLDISKLEDFIGKVEKMAKWKQVLELTNPHSTITEDDFEISLYRISEPGNYTDDAPAELVPLNGPVHLPYVLSGGKWHHPAFRLKIKNMGRHNLWVSLLFMDDHFGITNQLLPKRELQPGEEQWAEDIFKDHPYRTIPLQIADAYHDLGVTETADYLKLFLSRTELNTDDYNQAGVPRMEVVEGLRDQPDPLQIRYTNWITQEICLKVRRPWITEPLSRGKAISGLGLTVQAPQSFSGQLMFCSFEEATHGMMAPVNMSLENGAFFEPFLLAEGYHRSEGVSVLAFFELIQQDVINNTMPLRINFPSVKLEVQGTPVPYALDFTTGLFTQLPFRWADGQMLLFGLPDPSKSMYSGLTPTCKVFLHST